MGSNPASPTKYKHPHRRRCGFLFANTLLQQDCFVSPAISASMSVTSVTPITTMEHIYSYFSFWNLLLSWLRSSKRCNDGTYPAPSNLTYLLFADITPRKRDSNSYTPDSAGRQIRSGKSQPNNNARSERLWLSVCRHQGCLHSILHTGS